MSHNKNCIFCKIINHEYPVNMVYEDDFVMAFLDHDPISDGHTLIIPKQKIQDISELDEVLAGKILHMAGILATKIKSIWKYDGITIQQNNGDFQDVPHFHLHVFGRHKDNDIQIVYPKGDFSNTKRILENCEKLKN